MAEATPSEDRSSQACFSKCRWCGCEVQRLNIYSSDWFHRVGFRGSESPCLAANLSAHFVALVSNSVETDKTYNEDRHMDGAAKQHRFGQKQRAMEELVAWCKENVEFVVRNG